MKFAMTARYVDDTALIDNIRPAHRAYLATLAEQGALVASGPYVDGTGALIVYEADTLEAARKLAASDPFNQEGVFASHDVKEWKLVYVSPSITQA